jgi:hypothetical protein
MQVMTIRAGEERELSAEPATLLQAGHHGRDTSSSKAFACAATLIVLGVAPVRIDILTSIDGVTSFAAAWKRRADGRYAACMPTVPARCILPTLNARRCAPNRRRDARSTARSTRCMRAKGTEAMRNLIAETGPSESARTTCNRSGDERGVVKPVAEGPSVLRPSRPGDIDVPITRRRRHGRECSWCSCIP